MTSARRSPGCATWPRPGTSTRSSSASRPPSPGSSGARVNVPQTLDTACLDVVVHVGDPRTTSTAGASATDRRHERHRGAAAARHRARPGSTPRWDVVPWWESRDAEAARRHPRVGSDRPLPDAPPLAGDVARLRRQLTDRQRRLLRGGVRRRGGARRPPPRRAVPGNDGVPAAGLLARQLLERELDPIVLLVGGRRPPRRPPSPAAHWPTLWESARCSSPAAAGTVSSPASPGSSRSRRSGTMSTTPTSGCCTSSRPSSTRPGSGARLGDVVSDGCAAYAAQGFSPDEWHRHHQGGFSGFQPASSPPHRPATRS